MPSKLKRHRALGKELAAARSKHSELVDRIDQSRAKLEKRTRKLQALEARIAVLESKYYLPEEGRLGQADAGDANLRRARLIFNPKSGGIQKGVKDLDTIVGALRAHGIIADIGIKTSGKAARELAREAAADGQELVIVAAGDGTIEDVASQLVGSKTTLGIIPLGTMNNLARSLGIPLDLEGACALLGMGVTRPIDIGHVIANAKPQVEYFLETAGLGLSAVVIPAGQDVEKGRWSEIPDAIRKLFDARPCPVTVQLDKGEVIRANSQVVTVSNSPLMGSNILIAPDALVDDGLLDVAIYQDLSKTELLAYVMAAAGGKRADNPKVKFYRARNVRIESEELAEAHSDKDLLPVKQVVPGEKDSVAGLPADPATAAAQPGPNDKPQARYVLEIEIVPGAIRMIVGNGMALSLPVESAPDAPPPAGPQQ